MTKGVINAICHIADSPRFLIVISLANFPLSTELFTDSGILSIIAAIIIALAFIDQMRTINFEHNLLNKIRNIENNEKLKFNASIGKTLLYYEDLALRPIEIVTYALFIALIIGYFSGVDDEAVRIMYIILLAGLLLRYADITIARYRIATGLYGSNVFEARELAYFITKHSSKIDFTDGNKSKPIIATEDLENLTEVIARYPAIADLFPDFEPKTPAKA